MTKNIAYPKEYLKKCISDISALYYNLKDSNDFSKVTSAIICLNALLNKMEEKK